MNILMVSDNRVLGFTLALLGHQVRTLSDERGALDAAQAQPQLVLIDVSSAWVNGYQLARRLRQQLGREAYLVALSEDAQEEGRRLALLASFDAVLVKPVSAETVLQLTSANREGACVALAR
jgi:CheY-like chemotaxis protein